MVMSESDILQAALKLPAKRREKIAEVIMGSLKKSSRLHLDERWAREAESRVDALLDGKIESVPGKKVLSYRQRR